MSDYRHYPNRIRVQSQTSGTNWQILATDGVGYADYASLLAAGKTAFPGSPASFPMGVPRLIVESLASGNVTAGSLMQIATNTLISPASQDALIPSGDVLVYEDSDVKNVWIKKSVAGDVPILTGMF